MEYFLLKAGIELENILKIKNFLFLYGIKNQNDFYKLNENDLMNWALESKNKFNLDMSFFTNIHAKKIFQASLQWNNNGIFLI